MLTSIKGVYENGVVRLMEDAPPITHSEVLIIFPEGQTTEKKEVLEKKTGIRFGSLKGRFTIPDDFNEPIEDLKDYM